MPHLVGFVRRVNRMLDREDADRTADLVRSSLEQATTITEAAELAGLLTGDDDGGVRAILEGFPPSVDAALIATLRNAADRDLPVVVQWKPGLSVQLEVWEVVHNEVGQVSILLTTPYGPMLTAS